MFKAERNMAQYDQRPFCSCLAQTEFYGPEKEIQRNTETNCRTLAGDRETII